MEVNQKSAVGTVKKQRQLVQLSLVLGVETDTDVALDTDKARGLNRFSYSRLFFILTIRID